MPAADIPARRSRDSVLFVTLDSCRHDVLDAARVPHIRAVAPIHRAQAPSYYTYGSHSAMFVGFTPGMAELRQPLLNPKFAKLFKLVGGGFAGKGGEGYELTGHDIVDGFARAGFATIGAGAMGWFDPDTLPGRHLTRHFQRFHFQGAPISIRRQVDFLEARLAETEGDVFCFLNVGETHVPYWHEGADWPEHDNPCVPFQAVDRAAECRARQTACAEYADAQLAGLIERFRDSTILICGDHGDAWGEDGLWEHGIHHWTTTTVPLAMRVRGRPVEADPAARIAGAPPPRTGWLDRLRGRRAPAG